MDVQSIFNAGGILVKNPNYSKSKKNTEPEYITVSDINENTYKPSSNIFSQTAYNAALEGRGILGESKDFEKYENYGLTPNNWENLDAQLADRQSNWEKAWHATTQTLVSEIGLGTLRGISDLADFVIGGIIRSTTGEENDYTNPVSEQIKEWQKQFEDYQAIYTTPGVNIANGGLSNFGWWMSNMPSIASSLTLLIPSTGFAKGLSWIGKATKGTRLVGNTRRFLTNIDKYDRLAKEGRELGTLGRISQAINNENVVRRTNEAFNMGVNGFTSRIIENYQEANQVYQDMLPEIYNGDSSKGIPGIKDMSEQEYQNLIDRNSDVLEDVDTSDRSAVAKRIAKASADRTFNDDMINGLFDVYELYALRNLKRFMNAPMRASVRRSHLNSLRYPNKTAEEIAEIMSKRSFAEKAVDKISDYLYGSKTAIGAQLSEGVEEAVNYISQEEGIHYGHVLLGSEQESPFDTRLRDYVKNPQLYESAFWGVIGGVVFQAGGSKLAQARNAFNKMQDDKRRSEDAKSKESVTHGPWSEYFELPEVKARIENINARNQANIDLATQLDQIDRGVDPFNKENGVNKRLLTEEEKDIARDRAYNNRARRLLMDAMFVGNWDITRAYLEADEVRDAMTQMLISEAEKRAQEKGQTLSDEARNKIIADCKIRQEEAKLLADKIEDLYSRNMRAVGNAMRGKDETTGAKYSDIPTDYFQIIVAENIQRQLDADQFAANIEKYTPFINSEESNLKEELSRNGIDYKQAIRSFILAQQLGQIEAELEAAKKTIKEGRTENNIDARTISGQNAIRELEIRRKALVNLIKNTSPIFASGITNSTTEAANRIINIANTIINKRAIAATESDGIGGYKFNTYNERYRKLDDAIVNAYNADEESSWAEHNKALIEAGVLESLNPNNRSDFKEAARLADVFNESLGAALGQNGAIESLDNISHNLLQAYALVTHNEIAREIELSHIAKDKQSIRTLAHLKHNQMNAIRQVTLDMALNSIKGLYKKYFDAMDEAGVNSTTLAYGTLDKNARDRIKEILSDEDMKIYDDAMAIIALNNKSITQNENKETSAINSLLPEIIKDALYRSQQDEFEDVIDKPVEETKEEESQSSSTSQNSNLAVQNSSPSTTSTTTPKTNTSEKEQEKVDFTIWANGYKDTKPIASVYTDDNGNPIKLTQFDKDSRSYTDVTLIPVEGQDNTYELDFKSEQEDNAKDDSDEVYNNPYFFSVRTPFIDGGTIIDNPKVVINDDGTVVEVLPGIIDNPESVSASDEISPSSTGEEKPSGSTKTARSKSTTVDDIAAEFKEYDEIKKSPEARAAEVEYDSNDLKADICTEIMRYIGKQRAKNKPYDEEELYNNLKEKYKDKVSEKDFETAWKFSIKFGRKQAKKYLEIKEYTPIVDFIDASSITDAQLNADEASKANELIEKTFAKIVEDFAKRSVIEKTTSGKKVISLENLLRYANDIANDNTMAEILYDRFVKVLQNSDEYILIEGKKLNKESLIDKASITSEQRINQITGVNGRTIDILSKIGQAKTEKEKQNLYDILDSLEPEDDIEYVVNKNKTWIDLKKNGVIIAGIAVPKPTDDSYFLINRGWIVDIPKSNDGSKGKLETLFIKLLVDNTNDENLSQIPKLLNALKYIKRYKVDRATGEKVENYKKEYDEKADEIIKIIRGAVDLKQYIDLSNGYTNSDLVRHLFEVYNGVKQVSDQWLAKYGITEDEYAETIRDERIKSIHNFFENRRDSYNSALELANNPNKKVEIESVNHGGLVILDASKAKPINEEGVIGSSHKDKLDILVASITEPGTLYSTTGSVVKLGAMTPGSTFISIPNGSSNPALLHVFPQPVASDHFNKELKEIHKEIINEFNSLLSEWSNNPNKSADDITKFINLLCSSKNNNPLFRGLRVTPLTNGFKGIQIEFFRKEGNETKKVYVKLFDKHRNGNQGSVIQIGTNKPTAFKEKEIREKVLKEFNALLDEYLTYNLEFGHIRGLSTINGVAKFNTKGKFVITIPNGKKHTFDSYKDFIINNGVVSVPTESKNGRTNFYPYGTSENQFDKARITYRIVQPESQTPVKERNESKAPVVSDTKQNAGDKIKEVIQTNGKNDNVGEEIINTILNNTQLNVLKNSRLFKEIPLGNIIFVEKYNDIVAGHAPRKTTIDGITVEKGTIIVTQEWIKMLNDDDISKREEAVRHLIHEGVHRKIADLSKAQRQELFDKVRTIFNEFVEANKRDGVRDKYQWYEFNVDKKSQNRYYELGQLNEKGLEEFLVESITRPHLIERLNSIPTDGKKITKQKIGNTHSKNLFQKILAVISKVFGLNINKGSLLEKEYKLFEQVGLTFKENQQETKNKKDVTNNKESQQLEFNFEETQQEEIQQEEVKPEIATNINDITMESAMNMEIDEDDIDESRMTDTEIASLAQVRDTIIPENRKTFENLVSKGAIEINC